MTKLKVGLSLFISIFWYVLIFKHLYSIEINRIILILKLEEINVEGNLLFYNGSYIMITKFLPKFWQQLGFLFCNIE